MLLLRTKKKSLQQEWLLPASNNYHHHHRRHHHLQQPSLQILLVLLLLTLGTQTKEIQAQPVEGGNVEIKYVEIGQNVSIKCETTKNVTWLRNDKQLLKNSSDWLLSTQYTDVELDSLETELLPSVEKQKQEHLLTLPNFQFKHNGTYSCLDAGTNESISSYQLEGYIIPRVVLSSSAKVKQKIGKAVSLYCVFEVYPHNETLSKHFKWLKDDTSFGFLDSSAKFAALNATHVNLTLDLAEVYKKENGSYACVALTLDSLELARKNIDLLVMDVPQATIDYVKAVGADKIYMNWTINDGNDPIQKIFISYSMKGTNAFTYYKIVIGGGNTSFVLDGFKPNTEYLFRISAKNSIGDGQQTQFPNAVRTLEKDPEFIPQVESTGSTASTITIGWNPPPLELLEYIQYYELVISEAGEVPKIIEEAIYPQNSRNLPYMFDNLKTATEYEFKVRACSDLTKLCGNWSRVVNGTTMDGVASEPTELQVSCIHQNISRLNSVVITWNSPTKPNGKVVSYLINLVGRATYRLDGREHSEQWGPKMRRVDEPHHKTIYEGVQPNTRYTVNVSAITRHRKNGEIAVGTCEMPVSVPESIARANWIKVKTTEGQSIFKLYVPKVSERNGAICCYRLYLIRMGSNSQQELPPPEQLSISTYHEVHAANNTLGGAYIADMLPGDLFRSEVFLGDGKRFYENDVNHGSDVDAVCRRCLSGQPFLRKFHAVLQASSTPIPPPQSLAEITQSEHLQKSSNLTEEASKILQNKKRRRRRRRHPNEEGGNDDDESQLVADEEGVAADLAPPIAQDFVPERETVNTINALPPPPPSPQYADVFDGEIDMNSNYTGFLEVIVRDKDSVLYAYSPYFDVITPITAAEQFDEVNNMEVILTIAIHMLAILIGIVLVLLFILCSMHHFNRKNTASDEEAISLRDSLRAIFTGRSGGQHHRHFIGNSHAKSTDWAPIKKSDIHQAYKNRHKDTDYGFLREYELLPNRFSDRTTKNSDLKENASKNRYPDIKAYDQTRVKLSQLNGLSGSDYINANFVIGYKERKKFICAQGPMESTIQDFWRMIWEQHLEIIIMLTNLEEYNKSKCARYWPEKVLDTKKFGEITVKYAQEKKLGDYLIRIFDICKRSNAAGGEHEDERRQITQYHYLEWKDFMAPEHPHGIIKFIRHINAAYSVQRGPILVHCSAGVGRTGTLVALDSLMQQLDEEEQVSIYNTVCDLRHQRNFLVQSLKQYIFLYRALMDVAYFGNTELSAVQLSSTIEALKTKPYDGKDKCKLEVEFEKLIACVDETMKSCSVGSNEDNMCKNRNSAIIPYDRNRVILTPIPMKDNTTYINASFMEGYDSQESYIITQDPLENTIGDFWRMVSEQSISTLVMISEIGDGPGKCPRYWADDEIQYDHILVKYVASESCPYYTRREFNVTNCKIDDTICVTQFQYNGWPTVEGEVPEVCRGIIELVDQAQQHHAKEKNIGCRSPLTVHCSCGTDRSSIFVAMCILVKQLRFERSVDICSTARKIRSQRSGLLDTYAQYEFLHRAIANYADLHKLSTSASIEHQSPVQQQQPQQSSSSTVQIE